MRGQTGGLVLPNNYWPGDRHDRDLEVKTEQSRLCRQERKEGLEFQSESEVSSAIAKPSRPLSRVFHHLPIWLRIKY